MLVQGFMTMLIIFHCDKPIKRKMAKEKGHLLETYSKLQP